MNFSTILWKKKTSGGISEDNPVEISDRKPEKVPKEISGGISGKYIYTRS